MTETQHYTQVEEIPQIVRSLRNAYDEHITLDVKYRKGQLNKLLEFLTKYEVQILDALKRDMRKPSLEGLVSDIILARNDCVDAINGLDEWMKPVKPSVDFINAADNCQIRRDPLGVVLIIGTWNYPIQVTLMPLVGALAAGNCVVLKLSELAVNVSKLLTNTLTKLLDPKTFTIVNGEANVTTSLLEQKFDHIFYTGSTRIGKIIMSAASKHLCPVTLELGGKSPVIVDDNVEIENVARRVTWGRFMNAGQTCIAPDYILCTEKTREKLIPLIRKYLKEFYGDKIQSSKDYARVVSLGHFKRLKKVIDSSGGQIVIGGDDDENDLFISPTVIINASPESDLIKEEIFGPVLPIITISTIQEAINYVNQRDKPLALYVFSKNNNTIEKVLKETSSGGAVANDVLIHATVHSLPFGGVGASGIGSYHGKKTFEVFSHAKSVSWKSMGMEFTNDIRYPPYSNNRVKFINFFLSKKVNSFSTVKRLLWIIILAVFFIRNKNNRVVRALNILLGLE